MSLPKTALFDKSLSDVLTEAVHVGLLEFVRSSSSNEAVIRLLHDDTQHRQNDPMQTSWYDMRELLYERVQQEHASTPLARIIHDYGLTMPQLFTLALVGELEVSHAVNIAIAELQSPDRNSRPTLNLISVILKRLFDSDAAVVEVFDIAQQELVHQGLLRLSDTGPLSWQSLSLSPGLWSVLCNRLAKWPGCEPVADCNVQLPSRAQRQVEEAAAMFKGQDPSNSVEGIVLRGNPDCGRQQFAMKFGQSLGLKAVKIPLSLWRDRPDLVALCHYGNWLPVIKPDIAPGEQINLPKYINQPPVAIILDNHGAIDGLRVIEYTIHQPTRNERKQLWESALQTPAFSERLAGSALMSAQSIQTIASNAVHLAIQQNTAPGLNHILEARQKLGAEKLRLLAQPVNRIVTSDALVMPQLVEDSLKGVIDRACKRESLWEGLGITLQTTPNPGVRALFVGESGTGKTLAASYITTSLCAPLYRVDLSAVMNKYIGESEKNLAQLLDHAAAHDVVLLFDEADALFGRRSEGKETGERFANMLTNFLLTRIETHPGIVILTTNSRERIDNAFTRRIDVVVEFPLPGFDERLHLWCSHLGDRGPGEEVYRTLASYCELAGGQIRNAVLSAAVQARGDRITENDLLAGLRDEYRKIGRDMPRKVMQIVAS
jgi:hypothetical protein